MEVTLRLDFQQAIINYVKVFEVSQQQQMNISLHVFTANIADILKHQKKKKKMKLNGQNCPNWAPVKCRAPRNDIQINSAENEEKKITNGLEVEGKQFTLYAEDHNKIINLVAIETGEKHKRGMNLISSEAHVK